MYSIYTKQTKYHYNNTGWCYSKLDQQPFMNISLVLSIYVGRTRNIDRFVINVHVYWYNVSSIYNVLPMSQ